MQICLAPKPALFAFLWPCSSSFCLVSTVSSRVYSLFLNDYDIQTFSPLLKLWTPPPTPSRYNLLLNWNDWGHPPEAPSTLFSSYAFSFLCLLVANVVPLCYRFCSPLTKALLYGLFLFSYSFKLSFHSNSFSCTLKRKKKILKNIL